jgi:threonine synthase
MSASPKRFESAVDSRHHPASSVVLRYLNAVSWNESAANESRIDEARVKELLAQASIAEGLQIVPIADYRGVKIDILDESSLMHTRTLKSIDGCVTAALCKSQGIERVVFESGGNTGTALAAYAQRLGIESFCIVPEDNLPLLDSRIFSSPRLHLIAVEDPASLRELIALVEGVCAVTRVPRVPWRIMASEIVGCFILEQLLGGRRYDYLAQSISAAFGPIGIYRVLERNHAPMPGFIGVQQAQNAAMFNAWRAGTIDIEPAHFKSTKDLLSRVMYDATPQRYGTFDSLRELLDRSGGFLTTVDREEFDALIMRGPGIGGLQSLSAAGVEITRRGGEIVDEIFEKTGLMALAGIFKQIDAGAIAPNSRVLCCLTGGTANPDGRAIPELRIRNASSARGELLDRWGTGVTT